MIFTVLVVCLIGTSFLMYIAGVVFDAVHAATDAPVGNEQLAHRFELCR